MKTRQSYVKFSSYFAGLIFILAAFSTFAQTPTPVPFSVNNSPLPAPTGFVNDYAGVIDAATKQQLETKLKSFKDTTNPSVEIAVAVVKTTGDRDIFDYSLAVARGWKIGSKADNNPSALLFVAIDDHKYFTQVSKDLEGDLPDGAVGSIQRQYLVPEFKKGNYGKGISDTIDAYISTIRNKGNAPVAGNQNANTTRRPQNIGGGTGIGGSLFGLICCGIVIFVILLIIFTRKGGGSSGGLGGNIASGVIGGLIGSALSGGGSSGGWGGSSGGDSGGGFGGFGGGGDFGGGGSGGSW